MRGHLTIVKRFSLVCLLLLATAAKAQPPVHNYTVKDGKMYITLGKHLHPAVLDSFITKYDLGDLALPVFIKTGVSDSLYKLGWKVDINNSEIFVISKPLFGFDNFNDLGEKIIFMEKQDLSSRFPAISNQVHFGFNRFKNKAPFAVTDSVVTFYLRGFTNAIKVTLAGSFNNWDPMVLAMTKTDSGWIAPVKLGMGKYWYKFIVDGDWKVDKDNQNRENDGMGNDNSVYFKTNYVFNLAGYTDAKKVFVSGSFNGWKRNELLMQRTATGWNLPVYLSEGTHTYRFIADGNWFADPANPEKLPNEYNEFNSVVRLGTPYLFTFNGFTDATKVMLLGSFNNWKENELLMKKTATGWELPYTLGPGNYEYRYKIDGIPTADVQTKGNNALVIEPNFTFRLDGYENAKSVCISGDINNWNPGSFQMTHTDSGWIFRAHLNKGKYRYKFVVDGQWILDPANKLWEQNEYGTGNSVLWRETE